MTQNYAGEIDWREIENRWQIEAELRQKWPRRVVSRDRRGGCGAWAANGCVGGMLVFMFGVGLMMGFWAGLALLILPFGSETEGTITRHETSVSNGKIKGTRSYFLHFGFVWNDRNYAGEWPVSEKTYRQLRDGAPVKVRCFPFAPGLRPLLEGGASPWFHVWVLGPLGLLLIAVSGVALSGLFAPQSGKALVRRGVAAPAIVTQIETGNRDKITFLFRAGDQIVEKTQFSRRDSPGAAVGAVWTVLHDARRPQRALIYRFCDFRARLD